MSPRGDSSLREFLCGCSLKMALVLLILLMLVESTIISASGLLKHGKACGKYHISNSHDPSHEFFYIDGKLVDRYFFCKALRDYHEMQCFVTENVRNQYCRSLGIIELRFLNYLVFFLVLFVWFCRKWIYYSVDPDLYNSLDFVFSFYTNPSFNPVFCRQVAFACRKKIPKHCG